MVMNKTIKHLRFFQLHWMNTYIITTMNVLKEKQNGCHLLSTGQHPSVLLNLLFNVSRILDTYQTIEISSFYK